MSVTANHIARSASLRRALDGRRYGFVSGCRACGLLFANPVRSREEFTAFYSTSGVWAAGQHGRQPSGDVVNAIRGRLAEAGLDVAALPEQAAVLDIGCGDGGLLNGLQQLGWRTYGIEPAVKSAFVRHQEVERPACEHGDLLHRRVLSFES